MFACFASHLECAELLLNRQANISLRDKVYLMSTMTSLWRLTADHKCTEWVDSLDILLFENR